MSTSAVPAPAPERISASTRAWSVPARAVSYFSGTAGLAIKVALLALINALAIWAGAVLAGDGTWWAVGAVAGATAAIDCAYLAPRGFVPLKFLIPGTVFLIAFQLIPIVYNVNVAFTNYSTGHLLSKTEAIQGIQQNSLSETEGGTSYTMAAARDDGGKLVLILVDDTTGKTFVGTREGLEPLARDRVKTGALGIVSAEGFTIIKGAELAALDKTLSNYTVPTTGASAIRPQGLDTALELQPTLRYDARNDRFVRIDDRLVFSDNRRGSFVARNGEELEPGWKTGVGWENFSRLFKNKLVRGPFLRVLWWTILFATSCVLLSFALGLFLAITLNKAGMRFQRLYRSLLVVPYAVPAFLSLLVWRGLLNDDFGVLNDILHLHVPWLFDAGWAKVSIVLVSLWLTFPYFFLVSLGALQSIPAELTEAARVDGGGPFQIFRRVTFPLLLVSVAPLLIASFAFNFNNFNNIYLLTDGGPPSESSVAGGTDILISYTWKLAFSAGKGGDYGLASAVSIVIFFIVATISAVSFTRTKALENLR